MLKHAIVAAILVVSAWLGAVPAGASALDQIREARLTAVEPGIEGPTVTKHYLRTGDDAWFAVKGMRERRQVRFARWVDGLDGDRAEIFAREGAPTFRHLELEAGRTTEIWSYPASRATYVFLGNRLLAQHAF